MPKIKIEIEVPKYCDTCQLLNCDGVCELFLKELECLDDGYVSKLIRCKECIQAEVEDESLGMVSK